MYSLYIILLFNMCILLLCMYAHTSTITCVLTIYISLIYIHLFAYIHIYSLGVAYPFNVPIADCPNYTTLFPSPDDQLTFHTIKTRITNNIYTPKTPITRKNSNKSNVYNAIYLLFDDILRMISNGNEYNKTNKGYQVWRLADVMEKYVLRLRKNWVAAGTSANGTSTTITGLSAGADEGDGDGGERPDGEDEEGSVGGGAGSNEGEAEEV